MTEIIKDRDFKTNVNIESQTINYAKNPEKFKEDLEKAKNEIEDIGNVVKNTLNPPGKDKRNIFENLRAQRWTTSFYNVTGSRMEELSRQFKAREIDEKQLKEAVRELAKGYGKDIGIDFEVVYLDKDTMPKDSEGSTGSAYKSENGKILIPIDVEKIKKTGNLFGTITEEISHGKDALEGRQDKKVAEDNSNDEEGLESLGRPANEYVKNKLGEDNNSKIKLSTDGIDLSNADVGEKVGDVAITLPVAVGAVVVAGLMLPEENKEAIKKVTMQVYEDIKEGFNKFGNNIKVSYVVVKALIEEKLKEKGIEADVKIAEDKNGNVSYIVSPLPEDMKKQKIPPILLPEEEKNPRIPPMDPPKEETEKEKREREERARREEQEFFNELQKPNGIPILKEEPVNIIKSQVKPGDVVETPDNAKDKNKFRKGKNEGDSGYENLEDGSWWERDVAGDRAHSGSGSWKRWPKKPDRRHKKKDPDRRTINNEGKVLRKKYILDTFQIPLNEEESKKYFFKSIKEMNMLERKIYLKNERKYFKFLKILFRRNKKFILKIKNFYDFGIDNLFKREQKILKRELKKINKYNFKFKNLISIDKKYLEIFLKISYRDVFGHLNRYKIFFPKDKIYITSITDYHYIIIFLDDNKKKEIIKIANRCKLFIELLH